MWLLWFPCVEFFYDWDIYDQGSRRLNFPFLSPPGCCLPSLGWDGMGRERESLCQINECAAEYTLVNLGSISCFMGFCVTVRN